MWARMWERMWARMWARIVSIETGKDNLTATNTIQFVDMTLFYYQVVRIYFCIKTLAIILISPHQVLNYDW